MKEYLIGGIIEVVKMSIKSKIQSTIRSGLEKRVQVSNLQKGEVGIEERTPPPFPYIILRQYIRNGSEVPLKISKIDINLNVNATFLDRIEYSSDTKTNHGIIIERNMSFNILPHDLDFLRKYETTRLNQVISDFKNYFLRIKASGRIELQSPWGVKLQKDVGGEITIEPREWT